MWRSAGWTPHGAWTSYTLQPLFNFTWSGLFFRLHRPLWALIDVTLPWLAIPLNVLPFLRQDRVAAWLPLPYSAWTSFAFIPNAAIVKLN